eukprot:Rhum_TRINITY_DN10776_c0_g1::Rhum_TRINITY_DN10776_c0_g1_i1::g.40164::m.40164
MRVREKQGSRDPVWPLQLPPFCCAALATPLDDRQQVCERPQLHSLRVDVRQQVPREVVQVTRLRQHRLHAPHRRRRHQRHLHVPRPLRHVQEGGTLLRHLHPALLRLRIPPPLHPVRAHAVRALLQPRVVHSLARRAHPRLRVQRRGRGRPRRLCAAQQGGPPIGGQHAAGHEGDARRLAGGRVAAARAAVGCGGGGAGRQPLPAPAREDEPLAVVRVARHRRRHERVVQAQRAAVGGGGGGGRGGGGGGGGGLVVAAAHVVRADIERPHDQRAVRHPVAVARGVVRVEQVRRQARLLEADLEGGLRDAVRGEEGRLVPEGTAGHLGVGEDDGGGRSLPGLLIGLEHLDGAQLRADEVALHRVRTVAHETLDGKLVPHMVDGSAEDRLPRVRWDGRLPDVLEAVEASVGQRHGDQVPHPRHLGRQLVDQPHDAPAAHLHVLRPLHAVLQLILAPERARVARLPLRRPRRQHLLQHRRHVRVQRRHLLHRAAHRLLVVPVRRRTPDVHPPEPVAARAQRPRHQVERALLRHHAQVLLQLRHARRAARRTHPLPHVTQQHVGAVPAQVCGRERPLRRRVREHGEAALPPAAVARRVEERAAVRQRRRPTEVDVGRRDAGGLGDLLARERRAQGTQDGGERLLVGACAAGGVGVRVADGLRDGDVRVEGVADHV